MASCLSRSCKELPLGELYISNIHVQILIFLACPCGELRFPTCDKKLQISPTEYVIGELKQAS